MKGLALVVAFLLLSANTWAVTTEVPLGYDDAWLKAVQGFASEGIEFSVIDKEAGVIQGSKEFHNNPRYFICPRISGQPLSYSYSVAVIIQENDEQSSTVSINAKGLLKSYQNIKSFWSKNQTVNLEDECSSTGEMERHLLNEIYSESVNLQNDQLITQLQSSSQIERTRASKNIFRAGGTDAASYEAVADAIRNQLDTLNKHSPSEQQQEVAWHLRALSCSGNQKYLPLIEQLTESQARTVSRHAKKSKKVLANSGDCRE